MLLLVAVGVYAKHTATEKVGSLIGAGVPVDGDGSDASISPKLLGCYKDKVSHCSGMVNHSA